MKKYAKILVAALMTIGLVGCNQPATITQYRTVEFAMNDGTDEIYQTVSVENNKTVSRPEEDPVLDGFVFNGWYQEAEAENAFNFETLITQDTKIYADWLDAVTVKFIVDYELYGTQTVGVGQTVEEPDAPVVENSTFLGWYTDVEFTEEFDFEAPVLEDTLVYSKWEQNAWSELDKQDMVDTIGEVLPFMAFGNYESLASMMVDDDPEVGPILFIYAYSTPDFPQRYADLLDKNGFSVSLASFGYVGSKMTATLDMLVVQVMYDAEYEMAQIAAYRVMFEHEFPSAQLALYFSAEIPAFGEAWYSVDLIDSDGMFVVECFGTDLDETSADTYKDMLTEKGWAVSGDAESGYIAKITITAADLTSHDEYAIFYYDEDEGALVLQFAINSWPYADLATYFPTLDLPVLNGLNMGHDDYMESKYAYIIVNYDTTAEDANAFLNGLVSKKFILIDSQSQQTETGTKVYDYVFLSPDLTATVLFEIELSGANVVTPVFIQITDNISAGNTTTKFPASELTASFGVIFPEFETESRETLFNIQAELEYGYLANEYVDVYGINVTATDISNYANELAKEGWAVELQADGSYKATRNNGQMVILEATFGLISNDVFFFELTFSVENALVESIVCDGLGISDFAAYENPIIVSTKLNMTSHLEIDWSLFEIVEVIDSVTIYYVLDAVTVTGAEFNEVINGVLGDLDSKYFYQGTSSAGYTFLTSDLEYKLVVNYIWNNSQACVYVQISESGLSYVTWDEAVYAVNSKVALLNGAEIPSPYEDPDTEVVLDLRYLESYQEVDIQCPEMTVAEYGSILLQAGWINLGNNKFASPNYELQIRLLAAGTSLILECTLCAWTWAGVVSFYKSDLEVEFDLPNPGKAPYNYAYDEDDGSLIVVNEYSDIKGYKTLMEGDGWNVYEDPDYLYSYYAEKDEFENVLVNFYLTTTGDMYINIMTVEAPKTWAEAIEEAFSLIGADPVSLPDPGSTTGYSVDYNPNYNMSAIFCSDVNDLTDYLIALETNGWTVEEDEFYYDSYYLYKDGCDLIINVYLTESGQFAITFEKPAEPLTWSEALEESARLLGLDSISMPDPESELGYEVQDWIDSWGCVTIVCGEDIESTDEFTSALVADGWVEDEDGYYSKDGVILDVYLDYFGMLTIDIYLE